jgi:putative colanic acid biosynthesis UDP-glucose lipid carrier transferase
LKRGTWLQDDLIGVVRRLLDAIIIALAHLAFYVPYRGTPEREFWLSTAMAIGVFLTIGQSYGLYRRSVGQRWVEARSAVLSWLVVPAALSLVAFSTKTSADYSRVVSFSWFLAAPIGLVLARVVARVILIRVRRAGWNLQRIAIAGSSKNVEALCAELTGDPWQGVRVVGVFDDRRDPKRRAANDVLPNGGDFADMLAACRRGEIDAVYLNLPLAAKARTEHLLAALADSTASVFLVADFFTYDLMCASWSIVGRYPVVSVHDTPFRGSTALLKRVEDIVIGSLILTVISVPLLLIALAVKLTSKGPVFFAQRRYGLNGRPIRVLKFRTMSVCEDGPRIVQATRDDKRITRLGRFLRKTSLDELPQFFQVLTGEMSIVGPRPHAVAHNEEYRSLIRGYMLRHKVKPGITGWAQVNGWRGETPEVAMMEKRLQHDLEYIKSWSLLLDMKIILLTVFGKKKNQNAY